MQAAHALLLRRLATPRPWVVVDLGSQSFYTLSSYLHYASGYFSQASLLSFLTTTSQKHIPSKLKHGIGKDMLPTSQNRTMNTQINDEGSRQHPSPLLNTCSTYNEVPFPSQAKPRNKLRLQNHNLTCAVSHRTLSSTFHTRRGIYLANSRPSLSLLSCFILSCLVLSCPVYLSTGQPIDCILPFSN